MSVDQVAAGPGSERHPRDRGLALARGAVARAGGEIDRGGRDRLGERLLLALLLLALCSPPGLLVLDRVRVDVGLATAEWIDPLGDDVHLEVRSRDRRFHARRGL